MLAERTNVLCENSVPGGKALSLEVGSVCFIRYPCLPWLPGSSRTNSMLSPCLCLLLWGELVSFAFSPGLPGCWASNSGFRATVIETDEKMAPVSQPSLWLASPRIWAGLWLLCSGELWKSNPARFQSRYQEASTFSLGILWDPGIYGLGHMGDHRGPMCIHEWGTDFKEVGKGKIFSLKETILTAESGFAAEHQMLLSNPSHVKYMRHKYQISLSKISSQDQGTPYPFCFVSSFWQPLILFILFPHLIIWASTSTTMLFTSIKD